MTARWIPKILAAILLAALGPAGCGEQAAEEPIDTTLEQSYEEMRETDEPLARESAVENEAPDQSGDPQEAAGETETDSTAGK